MLILFDLLGSMARLLTEIEHEGIDLKYIAVHCHDTYGQALANIIVSLQVGMGIIIRILNTSTNRILPSSSFPINIVYSFRWVYELSIHQLLA